MAFLLFVLFLLCAVFFRMGIQWCRTGDLGLRLSNLHAPLIETLPGTLFVLTFFVSLALTAMGFYNQIEPIFELPIILKWAFFVLGGIGILISVISQQQMGNSWRIGVNQEEVTVLKTKGLYARSRNPIYFGILLFWIGVCGTFIHWWLLLSATICWVCIEIIVRKVEEPYLEKIHGQKFIQYMSHTKRYIPF